MKKASWLSKFINFIKDIFHKDSEEEEIKKSNAMKKRMCKSARGSNMCSMECDSCAWKVVEES